MMDELGIEEQLRELCERNSPPFDEAAFSDHLRTRTNPSRTQESARGRRSGLRVAVLASIAVVVVAALTVTTLEAVKYFDRHHRVLVLGGQAMVTTKTSGLYPVCVDGNWGYIDNTGAIKIQPRFDGAYDFSESLARVALTENGETKQGYIDTSGAVVIQPQFNFACDFSGGMAAVGQHGDTGPVGFIDTSGTLVIPMQYQYDGDFSDGLAVVGAAGGGFSFIDKTGATVLGPYDFAFGFSEGLAYVEKEGKRGFIDEKGRLIAELNSAAYDMSSYLSSVAPFPGSAQGFSEGLMALRSTSATARPDMGIPNKGYVDKTGAWVIEPRFNFACDFSEGLAAVCVDDKWGYIDKTGAWAIQPQFEFTSHFVEGMAAVWDIDGGLSKFGYIDKTGTVVIPMQYVQARDFSGGIAEVMSMSDASSGYPSYIDTTGKVIWQGKK